MELSVIITVAGIQGELRKCAPNTVLGSGDHDHFSFKASRPLLRANCSFMNYSSRAPGIKTTVRGYGPTIYQVFP